jgi:hypothetical protein
LPSRPAKAIFLSAAPDRAVAGEGKYTDNFPNCQYIRL